MVIATTASQANIDASWDLFRRTFSSEESKLTNLIFGTNQPPFPYDFCDPESELVQRIGQVVVKTMTEVAISVLIDEWRLNVDQVNQLQEHDERIPQLKQRIFNAVREKPAVKELRQERRQIITQYKNETLSN